jgi:hypothetical protein
MRKEHWQQVNDMTKTKFWNDMNQRRLIYAVFTLVATVPLIVPMGLPLTVNHWTKKFYDSIENLPEGSTILISNCIQTPPKGTEMEGPFLAFMRHIFAKPGLKFVIVSFYSDGPLAVEYAKTQLDMSKKVYGTDWVHLPYIAGMESALNAIGADIRQTTSLDYYGTPIANLPLMKDLNKAEDFDFSVLMLVGMSPGIEEHLRQWWYPHHLEFSAIATGISIPYVQQYYAQGLCHGYLQSVRGGAEYEKMLGFSGVSTSATESLSATHIFTIALVLIGNGKFVYDKYRGGKK